MLELEMDKLPKETREPLGRDMGVAVYEAVSDPRMARVSEYYQDDPNGIHHLRAGLLYILSHDRKFLVMDEEITRMLGSTPTLISPVQRVELKVAEGKEYPGLKTHYAMQKAARTKTMDLACEAVDDCIFWFDAITALDNPEADEEYLLNHPTIASAFSLVHTVHMVTKSLLEESRKRGKRFTLPESHAAFVKLFLEAPARFAEMGLTLRVDTNDNREPSSRGLCPAGTRDDTGGLTWYKTLAKLVIPIYLNSQ